MELPAVSEPNQYLTFKLAEEVFAVNVSQVREILEFNSITKVPKTPGYMRGVINLRGSVVPVVDLRQRFSMTATEKTVNTCIIVMEISVAEETLVIGALADSVQEVVDLEPGQVEAVPRIGTNLNTDFIKGMGKRDDGFVIILDIDRLFNEAELSEVVCPDHLEQGTALAC